jgi:hypothetical protein
MKPLLKRDWICLGLGFLFAMCGFLASPHHKEYAWIPAIGYGFCWRSWNTAPGKVENDA